MTTPSQAFSSCFMITIKKYSTSALQNRNPSLRNLERGSYIYKPIPSDSDAHINSSTSPLLLLLATSHISAALWNSDIDLPDLSWVDLWLIDWFLNFKLVWKQCLFGRTRPDFELASFSGLGSWGITLLWHWAVAVSCIPQPFLGAQGHDRHM